MVKVFVDGSYGTTGLRISERLAGRDDIRLLTVPFEYRHDADHRCSAYREADVAILCLPDDAAGEAASIAAGYGTAVIDASTAHRTSDGWTYGFPELGARRSEIAGADMVSNPGCHASGFEALVFPLVSSGIVSGSAKLQCFSITGYSGGGRKMIEHYKGAEHDDLVSPRMYGLTQEHKHLAEMKAVCGLSYSPVFCPIVADFYSGMETVVPLFAGDIKGTADDIREIYRNVYAGPVVRFAEYPDENGFMAADRFAGRDDMEISVFGNSERILLTARFDNLGKGASGAAIQNLNIMTGAKETEGLVTGGME